MAGMGLALHADQRSNVRTVRLAGKHNDCMVCCTLSIFPQHLDGVTVRVAVGGFGINYSAELKAMKADLRD